MIYLGSAIFKIARLLFVAMFSVHFFACLFFRVKILSAVTAEDVTAFYASKNVAQDVSTYTSIDNQVVFSSAITKYLMLHSVWFLVPQELANQYVSFSKKQ